MDQYNNIDQSVLNKLRKDKFTLVFTLPPVLQGIVSSKIRSNKFVDKNSVQYSIYSCPTPKIVSDPIDVPYSGQGYYISSYSRPKYEPATIKFTVDNQFKNYWLMWKWLSVLNDPLESMYAGPKVSGKPDADDKWNDYTTNFVLYARDEYNNPIVRFDYHHCFITSISPIEYSYRDPEEIDCDFTFVFNQFTITLLNSDSDDEQYTLESSLPNTTVIYKEQSKV